MPSSTKNSNSIYNSMLFRVPLYFIVALYYSYFSGLSLPDDGLRHIAFAANQESMLSWADIFPHSLFYKEYDPWYIWHLIIKFYLNFFSYTNVHLAINVTVLFLLMLLMDQLLLKYSNYKNSPLIIFVILSITLLATFRYINVRPDLLSGLFLIASLLLNRYVFTLFLLTLFYSTSYYLFFLYTGSVGLLYLILKDYRAFTALFLGSLLGLLLHLYFGGEYYVKTIIQLLTDQSLREGLEVGEGLPLFTFLKLFNYYLLVLLVWFIAFFIVHKNYDYFKKQPLALLLLILSPLWLAQLRYYSLFKPLMFLYLFIESRTILKLFFSKHIQYYIYQALHILRTFQYKTVFIIPALLYTIGVFGYLMKDNDRHEILEQKHYYTNEKFNNQTILLNSFTIDIYNALYLNPTLKFVPSCSVGWFDKNEKIKDIYIRMMKENGITEDELNLLIKYVGAKYYMHILSNPKQVLSFKKLKELNIEPILILDDKILFEKKSTN